MNTDESIDASPDENRSASQRRARRGRVTEIAALAAVVLAATAIGVAVWNPAPSKAAPQRKAAVVTSAVTGCTASSSKLTVQGTGTASATPDLLTLSLAINVTEPNAQQALASDNSEAAAVEHALGTAGVSAKDLQTTNLSIQPNYIWSDNRSVLTGYQVSNSLSANFHFPFSTAGSAIDAVTAIAGNDVQINSLSFSFANPAAVQDQARTNAVTQAVAHAQSMALAAGEHLGAICSITDNSTVEPYQPFEYENAPMASAGLAATPIKPGSEQQTDQVTVVYAIDTAAAGSTS